jgi:hypothetical protein
MYSKRITASLPDRFWPKVDKASDSNGCWLWTASIKTTGYGQIKGGDKMLLAHRVAYELVNGPIPVGMSIDHLCRVRSCVNPEHLEVVSMAENVRRATVKSHCLRGHEFTPENIYHRPDNHRRQCRACVRIRAARSSARRK